MSPYTPGPWHVQNGSVYDAQGRRLALMDREPNGLSPVEKTENARLMAAAPSLLRAAKAAALLLADEKPASATLAELRAAISAAEGSA